MLIKVIFIYFARIVLSHGELGILYASDHPYKPENLWGHFTADKCPTLAGKPKMFFIQVSPHSLYRCWGSGIGMFLGLPDPFVGGTDPDPDPSLFDFWIFKQKFFGFWCGAGATLQGSSVTFYPLLTVPVSTKKAGPK